jgi:hypothetical protein
MKTCVLLLFYYLLTLAGGGKPRLRQDIQDNIQLQESVSFVAYGFSNNF